MKAQELRDLRAARDDLERRVHDLKLTRQVTMQSLPSIRLVQENDKILVTKINSTLVNTVPLWETQLAQAVTIQRSAEAAEAVRDANDLTNELLTANAKNLRESNKMIREEMERGVFDIEAVKTGQRRSDRHHRGKPADRRRGQGAPRRRRRGSEKDGDRAARHAGFRQGQEDRPWRYRRHCGQGLRRCGGARRHGYGAALRRLRLWPLARTCPPRPAPRRRRAPRG